jgi:hypothetical protein
MFHTEQRKSYYFMSEPNPMTPALEIILRSASTYSPALELVVRERIRQIKEEGWLPEHDDAHVKGELAAAAQVYACVAEELVRGESLEYIRKQILEMPAGWPWDDDSFNPKDDPLRNIVIAAALCIAEADRILRARKEGK